MLDVPFISLDTLVWLPGWRQRPTDELKVKVREALDQNPRGWVVDGNYTTRLGPFLQNEATDIICKDFFQFNERKILPSSGFAHTGLDPPLALYLPRMCLRTLLRWLGFMPPCSTGCPEQLTKVLFSKESIVWWCISRHWVVRKRESNNLLLEGIHVGGKRRRIGGWGRELAEWKQSLQLMLRSRPSA